MIKNWLVVCMVVFLVVWWRKKWGDRLELDVFLLILLMVFMLENVLFFLLWLYFLIFIELFFFKDIFKNLKLESEILCLYCELLSRLVRLVYLLVWGCFGYLGICLLGIVCLLVCCFDRNVCLFWKKWLVKIEYCIFFK